MNGCDAKWRLRTTTFFFSLFQQLHLGLSCVHAVEPIFWSGYR